MTRCSPNGWRHAVGCGATLIGSTETTEAEDCSCGLSRYMDGHVFIEGTVYRVVFEVRGQPLPDGGRFPLPVDLYRLVPAYTP